VPDDCVGPLQEDCAQERQAQAALTRILSELDEPQRLTFVLYELRGWTMARIAEATGCPVQTSYARLYAARRKVQAAATRHVKGAGPGPGASSQSCLG
jgi:RNA polymerase sigma-70 factor, ECF subfamily